MSRNHHLAAIAVATICANANAVPQEKPAAVSDYEACALRVFQTSNKVSDVKRECEAEMAAYVAHHDDAVREKVRQRAEAETHVGLLIPIP